MIKHIGIDCQIYFIQIRIDILNNIVYDLQMDIQTKLNKIYETGLTQTKIAALLSIDIDTVSQAVVHRYLKGKNTRMPYDRAARVDDLYAKLKRQKKIKED